MKSQALAIAALVGCLLGTCSAQDGADDPAASLEKERQAGQAFVAHFRDRYGLTANARYREVAETALQRLGRVADTRPDLQWHVAVLRHDPKNPVARNASAWPGGYLLTDEALLRLVEEEAGGSASRMEGLVAGVLAHEMGHILHRDTDALVHLYFQEAKARPALLANTLTPGQHARRLSAAEQRMREERADRNGAFLLVRAGYRIEDMIAVFRRMAREEIGETLFTGELDHAKAADRVACLLRIQADVVEDQTRFDEAVTVLRLGLCGAPLESAIRNLELVKAHFPHTVAVRHALAAAYHHDYLASLPVAGREFRPAFGFYRFEAARETRLDAPHVESLRKAANAYEEILSRGEKTSYKGLGPTASAYALALAQLGRADDALPWARRAVDLGPDNWPAWNTLGNVLHLRGDAAGALEAYRRALSVVSARYRLDRVFRAVYGGGDEGLAAVAAERVGLMEFAPVYFNMASASRSARKTREAIGLYRLYLALDRDSEWNALARTQLGALGAPPVALRMTGLLGVQVTDPRSRVEKEWGPPEKQGKLSDGARVLKYLSKGVHVVLNDSECAAALLVQPAYRGEVGIEGIRIGVSPERIEGTFGPPVARHPAGTGTEAWDYPPFGVMFLMGPAGLARAVIYGRPDEALALPAVVPADEPGAGFAVALGASRVQVKARLGEPDRVLADGVWLYTTRGIRVRFSKGDSADLVVVTQPCRDAVASIRIGDSPSRITAEVGEGQACANLDDTVTRAFPERGVAYVLQDGQVMAMVLYLPQT